MMKMIKRGLTGLATVWMLTACGGGGGGSAQFQESAQAALEDTTVAVRKVPMQLNVPMEVAPGYKIVDASDDARVEITVKGEERNATLLSGSAWIELP
jgi:ABC-type glycerol-3-phosphate transport system substrate-binding protein